MDELLEQFLIEGRELVQQASDDLLALESVPTDRDRLDGAFRAIHTMKGAAGIFDLAPMGRALHAAEDLLDAVRRDRLAIERAQIDALLDVVGRCDDWIEAVGANGGTLPLDAEAVSIGLVAALSPTAVLSAGARSAPAPVPPFWLEPLLEAEGEAIRAALAEGGSVTAFRYRPASDCFFLGDDPMKLLRAVPGLVALRILVHSAPAGDLFDPFACRLTIEAASTALDADIRAVFRFVADQVEFAAATSSSAPPSGTAAARVERADFLRVAASHIDDLVASVGELVVARNGLDHLTSRLWGLDPELSRALAEALAAVDRQVADVHHRTLRLRLVPLSQTLGRLPRLVRETANAVGKNVSFATAGEAVEVDKAIADALYEPLLHLVRNAIDHGIEAPEVRSAAGKPPAGSLVLRAERVVDTVTITIADDGGGVHAARVRDVAVARGLLDRQAADALDHAAVLELLFAPGFSTAEAVSDVSGRGVGLDAVRSSIGSLGGSVTLDSVPGRGSSFRLVLPQRASVVPVLVVRAGDQHWGIPADVVSEILRLPVGALRSIHAGDAVIHRDRTLPVLPLVGLVGARTKARPAHGPLLILVARCGSEAIGLEVEAIEGRQDLLLRPLDGLLTASPILAGTAVMGDGRVLLILDIAELVA